MADRHIVVVGGGQVALLAATAIKRALPHFDVTLVRPPLDSAAWADAAHTTLPSLSVLHRRVGITEDMMLRRARATHWLGTRFIPADRDHSAFATGFGAAGGNLDRSSPERGDAFGGAAGAIATKGRFAFPSDDPASPLSDIDYALRFDADAHVGGLLVLARQIGIEIMSCENFAIEHDQAGNVVSLGIGGGVLHAELYVDCTGSKPQLARCSNWTSWQQQIAFDRCSVTFSAPALSPLDEIYGENTGLVLTSPGRDVTRHVRCWLAEKGQDAEITSGAVLEPGRLDGSWCGNVVAIGDASAVLPPVGWVNLHLAVVGIERLLELMPVYAGSTAERDEYNRRMGLAADRAADFVALHLMLTNERPPMSPTLRRTVEAFRRRRQFVAYEDDPIPRDMWRQLLNGLFPDARDAALAHALSPSVQEARRSAEVDRIRAAVALSQPYTEMFDAVMESK